MARRVSAKQRDQAARLLAQGRSTDEVGLQIGVRGSTIRNWRRNNAEFRQLLAQYEGGLYARGLLLAAEQGKQIAVKGKPGKEPAAVVRDVLVDMGRKDARRRDGGRDIYQEES